MAFFSQKDRINKVRSNSSDYNGGVEIVSPSLWIAVAGGFLLVLALFFWLIWGEIPQNITLQGVYMGEDTFICFADLKNGKNITEGMDVVIFLDSDTASTKNATSATITYVDSFDTDYQAAAEVLDSESLANYFLKDGPGYYVKCMSKTDESLQDSTPNMMEGTLVNARVQVDIIRPIALIIPELSNY